MPPLRSLRTAEAVGVNTGQSPRSRHSGKPKSDHETRTTDPRRPPAPSAPDRRNDRNVVFAGMLPSCPSANRDTVEKHDARAKAPPLLSASSRQPKPPGGRDELRVPRLHRSELRSAHETTAPRPATFASPASTPCCRSERGIALGAALASDLGQAEDGRYEQLPWSCVASPGLLPRCRSKRGIDLGAGSASNPGRAGDGHPIRNPRSCKERSLPPRSKLALLGLLALRGIAPKHAASLSLGLNR